ncbi:cytochrome c oxidase assembly protein [Curtobacterium sp. MCPF17_052]
MAAVLLVAAYVAGVVRLRRQGRSWPLRRSVSAGIAVVALVVATSGSLHTYDRFLVSANVGAHVLLGLVVPALVWAAAPVQLIRAAVHPRTDDSAGVAEWTTVFVDNAVVRYLVQPFPAFLLLAGIWWGLYATDVLRWSVSDAMGRTVVDLVFLLVGLLALPTLLTPIALGARRPSAAAFLVRAVGAVVVAAATISLGIAMQGPLGLLQASWFGAMGRTWGPDPLVDQARAGALLIVAGVLVVVAVVVVGAVRLWTRPGAGVGVGGGVGGAEDQPIAPAAASPADVPTSLPDADTATAVGDSGVASGSSAR